MGWKTTIQLQAGAMMGFFSLPHIQTGSEAQPTSYPIGSGGSCHSGKADHPFPSSAEVKNAWSHSSTQCLHSIVVN